MTAAIHAAAAAAASSTVIVLTVANGGGSVYGFQTAVFGSVSPTSLYGQSIVSIQSQLTNTTLTLNGVVAQNFFNRITVKYGASGATAANLTSVSATFTNPGGTQSQWTWATPTLSVTDNTLARFVIFNR